MYSGLAFSNRSGNWLGVHQKLDGAAYRQLMELVRREGRPVFFPDLEQILHFEGRNGPDGLKLKSPGHDEPHHFYNPHKPEEGELLNCLDDHFACLVEALAARNDERAAFEAAWLAHVIVDGLTPAHHYPYQHESRQVRGEAIGQQQRVLGKVFIGQADGWWALVDKNWRLWGSRGLILSHALFELGVALIIKPASFNRVRLSQPELRNCRQYGLKPFFKKTACQIADYEMYRNFQTWGWTPKLALEIKHFLAPSITNVIALAWWEAVCASRSRSAGRRLALGVG